MSFPDRHRRKVDLVFRMRQFTAYAPAQLLRFQTRPDPRVGIQQQSHLRRFRAGFQFSKAPIGPTISPVISPVPRMQPSHDSFGATAGGTISAMGFPKRVTRTGTRVLPTSARTARHVALNFEMGISLILPSYHSQRP